MVTPVTARGCLDESAACRVIEFLLQGGVEGVFVLGTTGEAASVPRADRLRVVDLTLKQVNGRALVYAGVNDNCLADAVEAGNQYLRAGIDAVVTLPPSYFPIQPKEMFGYFEKLLDQMQGPVILYNIPSTTHVSIPIDVLEKLAGHPRLAGVKDSENNAARLEELVNKLRDRDNFSIFIGVGALMAKMLLLGADGIVPSVGNLVPDLCHQLYESARAGDRARVADMEKKLIETAMLYQHGRTLGQSLGALKAAMNFRRLCEPTVLPPLLTLNENERESIRQEMVRLGILE
jgi:4-hydroxy-tetrahydrodipicolinate synthase